MEQQVMNLISGLVDNRVFFDVAPQDTVRPYITLQQVGGTPLEFLEGYSGSDFARLQVDVFASSRTQANEIMTAVRASLAEIKASAIGAPLSLYEQSVATFRRSCDFEILAPA
jgi:hypothetical protein